MDRCRQRQPQGEKLYQLEPRQPFRKHSSNGLHINLRLAAVFYMRLIFPFFILVIGMFAALLSRYVRRYDTAAERKDVKRQQKDPKLDKRIATAQRKEKQIK